MEADKPRPRVLVTEAVAEEGLALLRRQAEVDVRLSLSHNKLCALIGEYEALIVRGQTRVTADVLDRAGRLKVIARVGAALDNIDVGAAQQHNIQVVNSPDAFTLAVAEHTLGLLLALARRLPRADMSLKEGRWEEGQFVGTGLAGKTLGIVGFGRIGREVALRAQAFKMKVLVNQIRPTPELELEADVARLDLMELLPQADFLTLHVPYNEETHHLIGSAQLARMKRGAFLINTSPAAVIDEAALLQALDTGRIAGAALDVFASQADARKSPADRADVRSALARHPRVIATPRIAASTTEAHREASLTIAEQVLDQLRDVEPESILPLRVVRLEQVVPHESIDPRRVERLAQRIAAEERLANPIIVTLLGDRFMVLDGATRTAALKHLGVPHVVVQISSPESGLDVHTWHHVIQDIQLDRLLELLGGLSDISLVPTSPDTAKKVLFEYGGLCFLHTVNGAVYMVQPAPGVNRLDALNQFTEAYIGHSRVDRVLEEDMIRLQHEYPDMVAAVFFPEYTVSQIMQVTLSGRYFPAGITRFIIPGRILRLNLDLSFLTADRTLREKNRWLYDLLAEKLRQNQIRYYAEPIYLLDE